LRPPVWPHVTLEAFSMVGVTCYKRINITLPRAVKTVSTLSQDPKLRITYLTKKFKFILGTSVEKCDYSIL